MPFVRVVRRARPRRVLPAPGRRVQVRPLRLMRTRQPQRFVRPGIRQPQPVRKSLAFRPMPNIFGRMMNRHVMVRQQYRPVKAITHVPQPPVPTSPKPMAEPRIYEMEKWQGVVRNSRPKQYRTRRVKPVPPPVEPVKPVNPLGGFGLKLRRPLQPANSQTLDIFDKKLRRKVVEQYVLHDGGLKYIGGGFKKAKDFVVLPFPERLLPMFAISIRPKRFDNLLKRLGPWARHVQYWPGTQGELINKDDLIRDGIVMLHEYRKGESSLRRGEIGAYDAHIRLWQHISDEKLPYALILEDDADIQYSEHTVMRLTKMFDDIDKHQISYDLIYLGHNDYNPPKELISGTELGVPTKCQGIFSYLVTLEGVEKLLKIALPMGPPIDIRIMEACNYIRQLSLEPRLNWVVNVNSDTNNIW